MSFLKFNESKLPNICEFFSSLKHCGINEKEYQRAINDFSGYPKDYVYYDSPNKKLLGKMKDEFNRIKISEFVGLKSKIYSLISVDNKEINKAKEINKKLTHKEYIDVLFNKKIVRHNMKRIQSKLHEIGTYDIYKISLSCFDDKRYALDDGINTLAYFHKDIKD